MAKGFRVVERDQQFLLPPDMREWLPEDHLAWFVLDAVTALSDGCREKLRSSYRLGGVGRQAYDPEMLLALLIYAYAGGVRSSRKIERLCTTDVAFKVICGLHGPDHTTIARFRAERLGVVEELFAEVLRLSFGGMRLVRGPLTGSRSGTPGRCQWLLRSCASWMNSWNALTLRTVCWG
ncbi:transposase [Streptomyces brasiliensis]|uniref:Transposase InsH N-terminal domain-containing protein n=1 Tax=Streptomyces brasiliensis TaxID=1954 RepID=A0A917UP00_9ACTN|nr:transposase [Streptomyces brasiliensis]GGJ71430.1 hypothetical protein GCM10010121_097560 [Streptomyces brasiliensis]